MAWYNKKSIKVENLIVSLTIMALFRGIRDGYFKKSFSKSQLKTILELSLQVEKYINSEEAL